MKKKKKNNNNNNNNKNKKNSNNYSNSKTLILKDSSVRSNWTYLTAERHTQTQRQTDRQREGEA